MKSRAVMSLRSALRFIAADATVVTAGARSDRFARAYRDSERVRRDDSPRPASRPEPWIGRRGGGRPARSLRSVMRRSLKEWRLRESRHGSVYVNEVASLTLNGVLKHNIREIPARVLGDESLNDTYS